MPVTFMYKPSPNTAAGAAAATGAAVITVVPGTVTTRSVSMIYVRRMVICELSSSFTSR